MRRADLDDVMAIETLSFEDPWPRQAFENDLADGALAFMRVARLGEGIAGYLVAWRVAGELHLTNLAVAAQARRSGVARALVEALFGEARALKADMITLEVRVSNGAAIELYRSCGFTPAGIRKNYYQVGGEDALIMRVMLGEGETP